MRQCTYWGGPKCGQEASPPMSFESGQHTGGPWRNFGGEKGRYRWVEEVYRWQWCEHSLPSQPTR